MKIEDSVAKVVSLGADKIDHGSAKKTDASNAGIQATENVTLSSLSAQLQSLEATVSTDHVFDAEKVDAIKSAIARGQFKVDSEKVADGLINTVKDLITTSKA